MRSSKKILQMGMRMIMTMKISVYFNNSFTKLPDDNETVPVIRI